MDYKKLVEKALQSAKQSLVSEGMIYPEGITERMHPDLEKQLRQQKTSLGKHPAFPDGDERNFDELILGERFGEVCKRYKRAFDTDTIDNKTVMQNMMPLVYETMGLEAKHKQALTELAVKMVREEFDMDEDSVKINASLTDKINMEGAVMNETPTAMMGHMFNNHDDIVMANEEVYKRRLLNAMTQGAAKKCHHMYHMVDEELANIDPRLPNKYYKMMAAADYLYYVVPSLKENNGKAVSGGVVRVDFPTEENPTATINAEAVTFPVLIHELVKGVMELLSANGLPKDEVIGEYVINKADFLAAEPWDMRLGPALWERFTNLFDAEDFNLKHHVYAELCSLPVKEFNQKMKEIFANTKEGKKIIDTLVNKTKAELQEEEFNEAMKSLTDVNEDIDDNQDDFKWDDMSSLF